MSTPITASVVTSALPWVTPDVARLFEDKIRNEANGGVSPATLSSTIDSVTQMPADLLEGYTVAPSDVGALLVALLVLRDRLPGDTLLVDLLDDAGR